MSTFLPVFFRVQPQVLGSSFTLSPPPNTSSVSLSYGSVMWKVVEESTALPSLFSTAPWLPAGPGNQSPDVAFAFRSPSIPKPPTGGLTGAMPVGGGPSVKTVMAFTPEDWPVAVARSVEPRKSSPQMYQIVVKFPLSSVVVSDHSATKVSKPPAKSSSIRTVTTSFAPKPLPVMTTSLNG